MKLTNEEILNTITHAFMPLRCIPEWRDYRAKVQFAVFDNSGRKICTSPEILTRLLRDESELGQILDQLRKFVSPEK
jgi:hypothetical protein